MVSAVSQLEGQGYKLSVQQMHYWLISLFC